MARRSAASSTGCSRVRRCHPRFRFTMVREDLPRELAETFQSLADQTNWLARSRRRPRCSMPSLSSRPGTDVMHDSPGIPQVHHGRTRRAHCQDPRRGLGTVCWPNADLRSADPSGQRRMVDAADYARLWNTLVRKAARPDITRLLGQRMANGPSIPVLFALSTAPDLATGLARLAKFKHLFGPLRLVDQRTAQAVLGAGGAGRSERSVAGQPGGPQVVFLHERAQSLAVRPFAPVAVSMPLPQAERESFVDIFGLVPTEGEAALHYRLEDARIPFVSENSELWQATEADLLATARMVAGQTTFAERVRACFLDAFSITEPSVAYVCDCLHVSRTTLLRKLGPKASASRRCWPRRVDAGRALPDQKRVDQPADRAPGGLCRSQCVPARFQAVDRLDPARLAQGASGVGGSVSRHPLSPEENGVGAARENAPRAAESPFDPDLSWPGFGVCPAMGTALGSQVLHHRSPGSRPTRADGGGRSIPHVVDLCAVGSAP